VDPRFESTEIVRLRRNRIVLAVPLIVLLAGLLVVVLRRNTPDHDMLERVPRTLLADRDAPRELEPAMKQAQGMGKRVFDAWKNAPEPPQVRAHRSSLAHGQLVVAFALSLAVAIWQLNPFPRRRRGRLVAEQGTLSWNDERFVSLTELAQGLLRPGWSGSTILRLERRGPLPLAHELEVTDSGEGRRILAALGLDAWQRTATFLVSSLAETHRILKYGLVAVRLAALVFAGFVAIQLGRYGLLHERAAFGLGLLLFLVTLWLLRRWPMMVRVGIDGVLQQWLWLRRFVSYADVERIERFDWGVRLHVRNAAPLELTVFQASFFVPKKLVERFGRFLHWLTVRRDLLAQRIEDANGARRASALNTGEPSSEEAAREELRAILEDPWADAEARLHAARTLAPPKARLAAIAEATACPALRQALRALSTAARGD
jgi:hypothetical protein